MRYTFLSFVLLVVIGIVSASTNNLLLAILFFVLLSALPLVSGWEYKRNVE